MTVLKLIALSKSTRIVLGLFLIQKVLFDRKLLNKKKKQEYERAQQHKNFFDKFY